MIDISIDNNGVPSEDNIILGNQCENKDEYIHFDLPNEFDTYNKYVIATHKAKDKTTTKILPIVDGMFTITSDLTMLFGSWQLSIMCREKELDLQQDNIDITPQENEHVFISDSIIGTVNPASFPIPNIDNLELNSKLKTICDNLIVLIEDMKDLL